MCCMHLTQHAPNLLISVAHPHMPFHTWGAHSMGPSQTSLTPLEDKQGVSCWDYEGEEEPVMKWLKICQQV